MIIYAFVHLEIFKLVSSGSKHNFFELTDDQSQRCVSPRALKQMNPSQHCKSGPQRVLFSLKLRVLVYQMVSESGLKTSS